MEEFLLKKRGRIHGKILMRMPVKPPQGQLRYAIFFNYVRGVILIFGFHGH
jgi:hypothetical protein